MRTRSACCSIRLRATSHTLVYLMKKAAMGVNMTIVEAPARSVVGRVLAAVQSLVGKADVILRADCDNTIVAMLDAVIQSRRRQRNARLRAATSTP